MVWELLGGSAKVKGRSVTTEDALSYINLVDLSVTDNVIGPVKCKTLDGSSRLASSGSMTVVRTKRSSGEIDMDCVCNNNIYFIFISFYSINW